MVDWACSLNSVFRLSVYFKMIKICEFDHLIACSDYFARFLLFKRAFSMKKVMLKNSRTLRYALSFRRKWWRNISIYILQASP